MDSHLRPQECGEPRVWQTLGRRGTAVPPTVAFSAVACSGGVDCPVSQVARYDSKRARYLFPGGRTGVSGRGLLGRWGPNHAADPIVTRYHEGKLQVVLVLRNDGSGELAFPGGMVDPGATHSETLKSEFTQEGGQAWRSSRLAFLHLFAWCRLSRASRRLAYHGRGMDRNTR